MHTSIPSSSPAPSFVSSPKALNPVCTPVQSASYIQSPHSPPPGSADRTPPWRRLFRGVFGDRGSPSPSPSLSGGRVAELRLGAAADMRGTAANDLARRNSRSRSPFKAQKAGRGTSSWQLKEFAEATLGSGSLRKAVVLPEGEDENEWLAVNGEPSLKSMLRLLMRQSSTFTTKSISCTAQSPSFARRKAAPR